MVDRAAPSTATRRRLSRAALALAVVGAAYAVPATAAPLPSVAGVTVIEGRGRVGLRMWVPRRADIRSSDGTRPSADGVQLSVRNATYAFVGIANPSACGSDPFFRVCMTVQAAYFGALRRHPAAATFVSTIDPPALHPGLAEVYVVTDGTATLTLRFSNLSGSTRLTARSPVRAAMRQLPRRCSTPVASPPCDADVPGGGGSRTGWGGWTEDVGSTGFVMVAGLSQGGSPDPLGPTSLPKQTATPVTTCLYPWYGVDASPDPADHPYGCDVTGGSGADEATEHLTRLTETAYFPNTSGRGRFQVHYAARGRVYAGFTAGNASPQEAGTLAAYGVWIGAGVSS